MLHQEKGNLRKLFIFDEWNNNKLSKEVKGKKAIQFFLMSSIWNQVVFTFKVMAPLVHVLRLVDGESKATMGYIYEAMEKAKEIIMKSFNNDENTMMYLQSLITHGHVNFIAPCMLLVTF